MKRVLYVITAVTLSEWASEIATHKVKRSTMVRIFLLLLLFAVSFEAEGLQCTECYSFVSFEDCDSNKKEPERCPEGSQRCYTYMTEDKDVNGGDIQKFFEKGCTQYADQECNSEKPCQEFPGFLHILSEGRREMEKCSYKCCRQDNCNASSSHESGSGNGEDINEEI